MAKFVLETSPFFLRTPTFQLYNFMKHFISLIVLASLVVGSAYADTRSDKEMLDIARNAFAHPTSADNNIKRQAVRHVDIQKLMSSSEFNVYGSKSEGFVIVSRDDNFAPVLGYSSSEFDANKIPCGLKWWMNATDASNADTSPICVQKASHFRRLPHELLKAIIYSKAHGDRPGLSPTRHPASVRRGAWLRLCRR